MFAGTAGEAGARASRHRTSLLIDRTWLALAALAEADSDNFVTAQLLAAAHSVQHLSLRNQITLLIQAAERQITLRDLDTEQGWARRGRLPAQPGLQIVRPQGGPNEGGGHRRFRTTYRWEFSQTVPADCTVTAQATSRAAGDPAEFAGHLIDQLANYGYRVTPGSTTGADHHARLISIDEHTRHDTPSAAVRVLVPALAHALVSAVSGHFDAPDRRAG